MSDENRNMDHKVVFEPYDMDTALGTNNSGVLMFSPYLEDTDTVSSVIAGGDSGGSEAPVYNAQDSVLWNNIRDAFRSELVNMYRTLRASNGPWQYNAIEKRFEDHQAKWPEAIFNEDAWVKYIIPLVDPVTVDEETGELIRTDRYLTMLQGSKKEQRKWWLYNRLRYLDSKYDTGNASANIINIRFFNGGVLRLKTAIPMYAAVSFGGGTTPEIKRTEANTEVSFTYTPGTGVTEMETWIHSGNLITDVGDLSVFYPNECDFSKASLLRNLKIGSNTQGYSNANLTTINVRNSPLLRSIDCRNCPRLGITVNLENSPRLVEAYFDGTSITGLDLADGCVIETLHLPATVTALTLLNLSKLSEFVIPSYANVARLMLSNVNNQVIDIVTILESIHSNAQVNIQGLYLEFQDAEAIGDFFDILDTMTGVTRERSATTGEWVYHDVEQAVVSGEVHTAALTGEDLDALGSRYPYVQVTADHITTTLKYYNYDGSTLLYTETIYDGGNGMYSGTPSRPADARYTYTFAGWSLIPNGQADSNALKTVTRDRSVYAAYTAEGVKYTVYFMNDAGTIIQTVNNILYGGTAQFTGTIPSKTGVVDPEMYEFIGWEPSNENITGNTYCYPEYKYNGVIFRKLVDATFSGSYSNSLATKVVSGPFYKTKIYSLSLDACSLICKYAFMGASGLSYLYAPLLEEIEYCAFSEYYITTSLKYMYAPNLKRIGQWAFVSNYNTYGSLQTISGGTITINEIGIGAFCNLRQLNTDNILIDCSQISRIPSYAFQSTKFNGSNFINAYGLTHIKDYAFFNCSSLTYISFENLVEVSSFAFSRCQNLSGFSFPALKTIGSYAFSNCTNLDNVCLDVVTGIANYAFINCTNLKTFTMGSSHGDWFNFSNSTWFSGCTALESIYLYCPPLRNFHSQIFNSCPSTYSVYVLSSYYDAYMSDSSWITISSRIVSF